MTVDATVHISNGPFTRLESLAGPGPSEACGRPDREAGNSRPAANQATITVGRVGCVRAGHQAISPLGTCILAVIEVTRAGAIRPGDAIRARNRVRRDRARPEQQHRAQRERCRRAQRAHRGGRPRRPAALVLLAGAAARLRPALPLPAQPGGQTAAACARGRVRADPSTSCTRVFPHKVWALGGQKCVKKVDILVSTCPGSEVLRLK